MYKKIMVPVDLEHIAHLEKALSVAADLADHFQAPVCYVGITTETPSSIAHTPSEFADRLEEFGRSQAAKYGHQVTTKAYATHDPAIDLNDQLLAAVNEVGADLVVMASHIPGIADHIWPSHGGKIASHSAASVLLVR